LKPRLPADKLFSVTVPGEVSDEFEAGSCSICCSTNLSSSSSISGAMRSPTPIPICWPDDMLLVAVIRANISLKEEMISEVEDEPLGGMFVPERPFVEEIGL
jgi:hypothetical protein